jgi:squalene monooxygenase
MVNDKNAIVAEATKTEARSYAAVDLPYDVCIAGAGVAGASLAAYLGRKGIQVALIERDLSKPNKIIGELLQPGGVLELERMGLADVLEGIDAQPICGYALLNNGAQIRIPYPQKAGKPTFGRGFRYGRFIQNLRKAAAKTAAVTVIEGRVKDFDEDARRNSVTGVRYLPKGSDKERVIKASLTVVCDGCVSSFRRKLCNSEKIVSGYFLGLLLEDCPLPYPNHGHVFIGNGSPFLSYPVSSCDTRILIDFPGKLPKLKSEGFKEYLLDHVGKQLPENMLPSFAAAVEKQNFQGMPNNVMHAKPAAVPGAVLLGDSLNMRHPLTGGGMTVALTDVRALGDLLLKIEDFGCESRVTLAVNSYYAYRHKLTATINILASALYGVFTQPDLNDACFAYLSRGGKYAAGPIALLSGISRDLRLLIRHFSAVALFGAVQTVKPLPTPKKIARAYSILKEAIHIIDPLLRAEKPTIGTKMALRLAKIVFP